MSTLDSHLADFRAYIKELCPEAKIRVSRDVYETEDAGVFVYPPLDWNEDRCLDLEFKLAERSADVLDEYGYHILAYVLDPAMQLQEAQYQQEEAAQILAEAERLKLLTTA
jgi:hypothetical protein